MKFSKQKKEKMKKIAYKRLKRIYNGVPGFRIGKYGIIVDKATAKGNVYFLVKDIKKKSYEIYKVVRRGEFVKVDGKRILVSIRELFNHENWYFHSEFEIGKDGKLKNVISGSIFGKRGYTLIKPVKAT